MVSGSSKKAADPMDFLGKKDKEEEKDSCPIKSAKKKKKKLSGNELLEKLAKDIEEL